MVAVLNSDTQECVHDCTGDADDIDAESHGGWRASSTEVHKVRFIGLNGNADIREFISYTLKHHGQGAIKRKCYGGTVSKTIVSELM